MIYLATAGNDARIWDAPTFKLLEVFSPHEDHFSELSDLCWSHDGSVIASCAKSDRSVYVRRLKTSSTIPSESFEVSAGCQCLDFNSSSRYLLCGCLDGAIHVWDRKTQSLKKSYTSHTFPVTAARWNWNDTYIALGSENGEILLYNVVTGQVSSPLVAPSVQSIRQLRYNPYQKAALISVSEGGTVNFWDTNTRRLVHSFNSTHNAPSTDLAFSPINDCLMVTVGLDKRAVFYDVQSKSPINTIVADFPLTCVDMMHDGATVVVGTTKGNISFYDVRQASTPVFELGAHKTSVTCLSFLRKDEGKTDAKLARKLLPTTPLSLSDVNQSNHNNSPMSGYSPRGNSITKTGVISPRREGSANYGRISAELSAGNEHMFSPLNKSVTGNISKGAKDLFSPLHGDVSVNVNSKLGTSSLLENYSLTKMLDLGNNSKGEVSMGSHLPPGQYFPDLHNDSHVASFEQAGYATPDTHEKGGEQLDSRRKVSPPSRLQKGIGASPSLQKITSPRSSSYSSPPRTRTLESHQTTPPRLPGPGGEGQDGLAAGALGSTSSHRSPGAPSSPERFKNGTSASSSPPHYRSDFHEAAAQPADPTVTSLRPLVRELFGEHIQQLKSDLRAMMGPALASSSTTQSSSGANSGVQVESRQANPSMFQAEFICNFIREEMVDLRELLKREALLTRFEMIKQIFHLEKQMEACISECMINPVLLEEIERLKAENARLKKTF